MIENFEAREAACAGDPEIAAELRHIRVAAAAEREAAAAAGKCPKCEAECEQPLECNCCGELCCPSCAPSGTCDDCFDDEDEGRRKPAAAAARATVFKPLPLASHQALLPAPLVTATTPAAATPPRPSITPEAEIARLEALIPATLCPKERFRIQSHICSIASGETKPFLSQKEIEDRSVVLYQELNRATNDFEKWQLCKQLEQLASGIDIGACVPGRQLAELEARLEASTVNDERYALAAEINSLR